MKASLIKTNIFPLRTCHLFRGFYNCDVKPHVFDLVTQIHRTQNKWHVLIGKISVSAKEQFEKHHFSSADM